MNSQRIVFCTCGSLGDLYPFVALALEMKRRGAAPVIATAPFYRQLVEGKGIEFHPVRPDVDGNDPEVLRRAMDLRTGGRYVICDVLFPALRDSYADTAQIAADADLLVTHPMSFAASLFARKTGIPWASLALAPISLYSAHDASVFAGFPFATTLAGLGPFFQRQLLKGLTSLYEPLWKPFRALERELGLEAVPNPMFWGYPSQLTLGLFSPLLAAPQPDWPSTAHATGFPFFEHAEGNSPELQRFLDAGEPPIVFTLGSAAVGVAGDFFQQSAEAARSLGRRAVLLVGRDPRNLPKNLPPAVMAVPYAPHAAVFSRAGVIVHQGGIGTTGEAMRAGRPMLVVPYSHDQPDHARRLTRLGIARSIPRQRYNAEITTREIGALLQDTKYADRAAEIGARVRNETGVQTACDLLSGLLAKSQAKEISRQVALAIA